MLLIILIITRFLNLVENVPQLIKPIDDIEVDYCQPSSFDFSEIFQDPQDGFNVKLQLLNSSLSLYSDGNNEVYFDENGKTLYIAPMVSKVDSTQSPKIFQLVLRAIDSQGNRADENFTVTFTGQIPKYLALFEYAFVYKAARSSATTADYFIFLNKIKTLWKTDKIATYNFVTFKFTFNLISLIDCTLPSSTVCPRSEIGDRKSSVLNSEDEISEIFKTLLQPEFNYIDRFTVKQLGVCEIDITNNAAPFINIQSQFGRYRINRRNVFASIPVDNNLIYDEEDGNMYNLKAELISNEDSTFNQKTSWIGIGNGGYRENKTLYLIFMDSTFNFIKEKFVENQYLNKSQFFMKVYDSQQKSLEYAIDLTFLDLPNLNFKHSYTVEFKFQCFDIVQYIYARQIYILWLKFKNYFPSNIYGEIYVRSYEITQKNGNQGSGVIRWSIKIEETCDLSLINEIREIIFSNGVSGEVNPTLIENLKPEFLLETATDTLTELCKIEKPIVNKKIPTLEISHCGLFTYVIPEDTFTDSQDGNTRNLKLTLSLDESDRSIISPLYLDETTQTIYAMLSNELSSNYTSQGKDTAKFKLTATDATGQAAETTFEVKIIDTPELDISFEVNLILGFQQGSINGRVDILFFKKLESYFNVSGKYFQITQQEIKSNSYNLYFTNCTLRKSPCDVIGIKYMEDSLETSDGFNPSFIDAIKPEFNLQLVLKIKREPCKKDEPPEVETRIDDIDVTTCNSKVFQIPANTFSDREQGDTRTLSLKVMDKSSKQELPKNSFIYFQPSTQQLIIVADNSQVSQQIQIVATDINGGEASLDVNINIQKAQNMPTHQFIMKFIQSTNKYSNFVFMFHSIREKIKNYFQDPEDVNSVEFLQTKLISGGFPENSQHEVTWSNCVIARTQCDKVQVEAIAEKLIQNGIVNNEFKNAMSDEFDITDLKLEYIGECAPKKPPTVQNKIPNQKVSYCNFLEYIIPENTFYDEVDTNTRNLKLKLTDSDGTVLSPTNWVYLDPVSQKIVVIASESNTEIKQQQTFKLHATNRFGLSTATDFIVELTGEAKELSVFFNILLFAVTDASTLILKNMIAKLIKFYENIFSSIYLYRASIDGSIYSIEFTSCTAVYEPCDRTFISNILELSRAEGNPTDALIESMKPYEAYFFQQKLIGDVCKPPSFRPKVVKPIEPISLSRCSSFNVKFPKDTFNDEEDGKNLQLIIMEINGVPTSQQSQWINVDSQNFAFYGVVTTYVAENAPENGYQIVLRAQDSTNLFVDTNVSISIKQNQQINSYYEFSLQLQINTNINDLDLKIDVLKAIESYISEKIEVTDYTKSENIFDFVWTSCGLLPYCSQSDINELSATIFQAENAVKEEFSALFTGDVTFKSIVLNTDKKCEGPLDPPTPRVKEATVEMKTCGGYKFLLNNDTFVDKQDGNIYNMRLQVLDESKQDVTIKYYWFYYDDSSKTIYAYPTISQAIKFNKENENEKFYLTATDSSGLQASIEITIRFIIPREPKYLFTFAFQSTLAGKNLLLLAFDLSEKLHSFKGDQQATVAYQTISENSVTYFNCSLSYNPCDIAKLTAVKNSYLNDAGKPRNSIINHLGSGYQLKFITTTIFSPCGDKNFPPINEKLIPTIDFDVCEFNVFIIPRETFYDYEDGRKLTYSLKTKGHNIALPDWLYFNGNTRQIYYHGYANAIQNQQGVRDFSFSLIATDSTGLSTSTDLKMTMQGPYQILIECAIEFTIEYSIDITQFTNYQLNLYIVQNISQYLNIQVNELGIVFGAKVSKFIYRSRWSYCSSLYKNTNTASQSLQVDYRNFYYKVLKKVFQADKTITIAFQNFFRGLQNVKGITDIKPVFTGRCANFPPFIVSSSEINLKIQYGGYIMQKYESNELFEDFEDGYSLSIKMLSSAYTEVAIDSWIHFDMSSYAIYAVTDYYVRQSSANFFIFYLRGIDKGGKYTDIKITITKSFTQNVVLPPYNVTYQVTWKGSFDTVYARQSVILINQIFSYFKLTSYFEVLVWWYYRTNGYPECRYIMWTLAGQNCNSNPYKSIRELVSLDIFPTEFANLFGDFFTISRLYYQTTCQVEPIPPVPNPPFEPPVIPFCSLYSFQIPMKTFEDAQDVDLRNMRLRILDSTGKPVDRTSWIQINQATLQIYAISIRSIFRQFSTFEYQLQAENSAGLKSAINFKVSMDNSPFTSDCPIRMKFKYNYETSDQANLDILWRIVEKIQAFYGDSVLNIKVLDFYKENSWYFLSWSNCSTTFQFSSISQAQVGMTEGQRSLISAVFQRVVTAENKITVEFQSFMSAEYEIEYITASYCCIEKPPTANQKEIQTFASFCRTYKVQIDKNTFTDECDGNLDTLKLSFHYPSGNLVNINEWVQLNEKEKFIYGVVTEAISNNQPKNGFSYLIAATDFSGKITTIPYNIRITDLKKNFQVYFITGFENFYSSKTPAVFILFRLQDAIGKVIDPSSSNHNVYIKSYRYPKEILWSYCKLISCSSEQVVKVLESIQDNLYDNIPNINLLAQLSPNIIPLSVTLNMFDVKCASSEESIIAKPIPETNITTCGNFTLDLPNDLFQGSDGSTNKNFFIEATDAKGLSLSLDAWIQFDAAYQHFHGIAIIGKIAYQNTFYIQATHPKSGKKASTSLQINFPNYDIFNNDVIPYCKVTTTVESNYQTAYEDVAVIAIFISTLAKYLEKTSLDIQILNYEKNIQTKTWTIIWTDCDAVLTLYTEKNSQQYFASLNQILSKMFSSFESIESTVTSQKMQTYFSTYSSFTKITNSLQDSCFVPPNTPPKPISETYTIIVPRCGYFQSQLPNDLFQDEQDGGIDKLSLNMKYKNTEIAKESWIILKDLSIHLLPENETLRNYISSQGYRFVLTATDKGGLSASLVLIVKFDDSTQYKPAAVRLAITGINSIDSTYALIDKQEILNEVGLLASLQNENLFMTYETEFSTVPFKAVIALCNRCSDLIFNLNGIQKEDLNVKLQPKFEITSTKSSIYPYCDTVLGEEKSDNRRIKYCGFLNIDLDEAFGLKSSPDIETVFRDGKQNELQQESIGWYNNDNYKIEFFPREEDFLVSNTNEFNFTLWFEQNGVLFSLKTLYIVRLDARDESIDNIVYSMVFESTFDSNNMNNFFISKIMALLQEYIKDKDKEPIFYDFRRLQKQPFTFSLDWKICLPKSKTEVCDNKDIPILNDLFYDEARNLKIEFKNLFSPSFQLQSITNNCENKKPVAKQNITIQLPVCGVFEYRLPDNITTDIEDGGVENLAIELRTKDSELMDRDTYIDADNNQKRIIAITSELTLDSVKSNIEMLILRYYDKNGEFAKSYVTANLLGKENTNHHQSFYEIKFIFTSSYPTTTKYLYIQENFLKKLAEYSGDNTMSYYHVETFIKEKSGENYRITIGNCTIDSKICADVGEKVDTLEKKLFTGSNQLSNEIKDYFSPEFQIDDAEIEKFYSIDEKPILTTSVENLILKSCCEIMIRKFTSQDIIDEETPFKRLKMTLISVNSSENYFLYELQSGEISLIPIGYLNAGSYPFILHVSDACNNSLQIPLNVQLEQSCLKNFGYLITFEIMKSPLFPPIRIVILLKTFLQSFFQDLKDQLSVTYYKEHENKIEVTMGNCSVKYEPCDKPAVQAISKKLIKNGNISEEFLLNIGYIFTFLKVSEYYTKECSNESITPPKPKYQKLQFNRTFCSEVGIKLENDLFQNDKKKILSEFKLKLLSEDKKELPIDEWIYLSESNTLIGYPVIDSYTPKRFFIYYLRAFASNEVYTDLKIEIKIKGDVPKLNYRLILSANLNEPSNLPDPYYSTRLLDYLKDQFQEGDLNLIEFKRNNVFKESSTLTFSFCSIKRDLCECIFVKKTQKLIKENSIIENSPPGFVLKDFSYELFEQCVTNEPPRVQNSEVSLIETKVGQPQRVEYPEDTFVDHEDGGIENLTITLLNEKSETMTSTDWIKLNGLSICGIMTVMDYTRKDYRSTNEYSVKATDACGLSAKDSFRVNFENTDIETDRYYLFSINNEYGEFIRNCTNMEVIIDVLSEFITMPKDDIYILDIYPSQNVTNGTDIKWSVKERTIRLCDGSSRNITERVLGSAGESSFFNTMKAVGFETEEPTLSCPVVQTTTTTESPPIVIGYSWLIYLFIALLALLLLLFFLWLLIPRLCKNCCTSGLCSECCGRGGRYASKGHDPETGVIDPRYIDSPPQSPQIDTKPKQGDDTGRRVSTASQTDLLPRSTDDAVDAGRGYGRENRQGYASDGDYRSSENRFSSNIKEDITIRDKFSHYDHASYNSNDIKRSQTDGRIELDGRQKNWSVEAWKDPRPEIEYRRYYKTNDAKYKTLDDENRHGGYMSEYREKRRRAGKRSRTYDARESRGYSQRNSEYYMDGDYADGNEGTVMVRDGRRYEGYVADPETITLTLPRNVIEEYLERRFQKIKGSRRRRRSSRKRQYIVESSDRLGDALVDKSGYKSRQFHYDNDSRRMKVRKRYLTSDSSTTTPRLRYEYMEEPIYYLTSDDTNDMYTTTDGGREEGISYIKNKEYSRKYLGSSSNNRRMYRRRRYLTS